MKKVLRIVIILVVVLAVGVGSLFAYQRVQAAQHQTAIASIQMTTLKKGSLSATVGATGAVRAKQSAAVSWQMSGSVGQINVQLGDQVKAGQVLATINGSSVPASYLQAQSNLAADQQALDTLLNSDTGRAQALLALTNAQTAYTTAKNKRDSMNYPRATQTDIQGYYAKYLLAEENLSKAQQNFNSTNGLPDTDTRRIQAMNALSQAEIASAQALGNYNWITGKPNASDVALADANLAVAAAQLDDAQRAYDKIKYGPSQTDIDAAKAKVAADQIILNQAQIVAPFDGVITGIANQVGDQVGPGTAAFRVDNLSALYVDLQVSEVDINNLAIGQPVSVSFDAIPDKTYTGKTVQIDTVGTTTNGVVNFTVTVQMTDNDAKVRPGMTASANVTVAQEQNVLVVPNSALRMINNQHVVYTLTNGQPRPVFVQVGLASDTQTQITSNRLKEGDQIMQNPPANLASLRATNTGLGGIFGAIFGRNTTRVTGGFGGGNFGGGNFNGGNFGGGNRGGNGGTGGNGGNFNGGNGGANRPAGTTGGAQ